MAPLSKEGLCSYELSFQRIIIGEVFMVLKVKKKVKAKYHIEYDTTHVSTQTQEHSIYDSVLFFLDYIFIKYIIV